MVKELGVEAMGRSDGGNEAGDNGQPVHRQPEPAARPSVPGEAHQRVAWAVKDRVNAIIRSSFAEFADLHGLLLKAAERLRATEIQANKEVREQMGVEESNPAP